MQNMIVVSTGKGNVNLRATPHYSAKLVTTIRTGEAVRVIKYKYMDKDKDGNVRYYYKLAKKYKDKYAGYICTGNLKSASAVSVDYDYSSVAIVFFTTPSTIFCTTTSQTYLLFSLYLFKVTFP